ncbi:MAG: inorganic phosphate transporter [Holophaga sp.]|nr:inorganic phosphate transporter [Holophaga sp.]
MHLLLDAPNLTMGLFLLLAVGLALAFEFINGFHDTANAVATVIYTNSLPATLAVVWSGLWNLAGVLCSSGAVAFAVVALLPVDLVLNAGSGAGLAMVFSLLISAIIWNLGTWWVGLPASSSHSLVGAILGVGLGHSVMQTGRVLGSGVNWGKAAEVGISLMVSPLVGFLGGALTLLLLKALVRKPELYRAPGKQPPPAWIRGLLVLTCTGVSFAHGSNDGQKGMGLVMLILVGILPGSYALRMNTNPAVIRQVAEDAGPAVRILERHAGGRELAPEAASRELSRFLNYESRAGSLTGPALAAKGRSLERRLAGIQGFAQLDAKDRAGLREDAFLLVDSLRKLERTGAFPDPGERAALKTFEGHLVRATQFIPFWVKLSVALALGLGTMVGWKRIVVTVGEKIGKDHLSYAQGASAEMVAMVTIGAADLLGFPVSTTHVLSSGVAGTMAANHSGIQGGTVRSMLLAWILTVPVCVFLGASTFALGLYLALHVFGLQ